MTMQKRAAGSSQCRRRVRSRRSLVARPRAARWGVGAAIIIGLASMAPAEIPPISETVVWTAGADGYACCRIPSIVVSPDGTLLAFAEGRVYSCADGGGGDVDVIMRRSLDNGATWTAQVVLADLGPATSIGSPCAIVDHHTGVVWLACRGGGRTYLMGSQDNGQTWTSPDDITDDIVAPDWHALSGPRPGHGIQLASGRLVLPARMSSVEHASRAYIIYSDDRGVSWNIGGLAQDYSDEAQVVQTVDGAIYLNARNAVGPDPGVRMYAWSHDGGQSFTDFGVDHSLIEPVETNGCMASLVRYTSVPADAMNRILFSNPASSTVRERLTVRVSYDEAMSWSDGMLVHRGPAAYSDLVALPDGTAGVLYEGGQSYRYETIRFARFTSAWVDGDVDYAVWEFNEQDSGIAPITPRFLIDASGFGQAATAVSGPQYVGGDPLFGATPALSFDSGADHVVYADQGLSELFDFDTHHSFTIEVLVRTTAHGPSDEPGALVAKDVGPNQPSWWLRIEDGKPRFLIDDGLGDGDVTTFRWQDRAPAGGLNDAVQEDEAAEPTVIPGGSPLGDRPVVRFNGTIDFLDIAAAPALDTDELTWFVVGRAVTNPPTGVVLRSRYTGIGGSTSPSHLVAWGTYMSALYGGGPRSYARSSVGDLQGVSAPLSSPGEFFITSAIWNAADDISTWMTDDSGVTTLGPDSPGTGADATPHGHQITRIGAGIESEGAPQDFFVGDIAEILVYGAALSDSERAAVEDYLHARWFAGADPNLSVTDDLIVWLKADDGVIEDDTDGHVVIAEATDSVNDGAWHHVAAVRDADLDTVAIYVDRALSALAADTATGTLANDHDLIIGAFNAGNRQLTGEIDFVRITRRALEPAEFRKSADVDGNGILDAADFSALANCLGGPAVTTAPAGCAPDDWTRADLDGDGDVDLRDLSVFSQMFVNP